MRFVGGQLVAIWLQPGRMSVHMWPRGSLYITSSVSLFASFCGILPQRKLISELKTPTYMVEVMGWSSSTITMFGFETTFWSSGLYDLSVILLLFILSSLLLLGLYRIFLHPLAKVPGPLIAKLTSLWHVGHAWLGDDGATLQILHRKYGKVVRIRPNTVDIADGAALGPIYVDKGGFPKTSDYHNFYVDGYPTIFSTSDPAYRATRAKPVAQLFSVAAIRRDSGRLHDCVERFVQRLQRRKSDSKDGLVDLQEPARTLGFDVLASYLFRHEYPSKAEDPDEKSIIPWLNAFVDAGQYFFFYNRLFGLCISNLESWRPQKELERKSAAAVHDYTLNLPSDGGEKNSTYQGKLHQHGVPANQIAAECKDVIFAATHSFGAVLAATLWYIAKDSTV